MHISNLKNLKNHFSKQTDPRNFFINVIISMKLQPVSRLIFEDIFRQSAGYDGLTAARIMSNCNITPFLFRKGIKELQDKGMISYSPGGMNTVGQKRNSFFGVFTPDHWSLPEKETKGDSLNEKLKVSIDFLPSDVNYKVTRILESEDSIFKKKAKVEFVFDQKKEDCLEDLTSKQLEEMNIINIKLNSYASLSAS